MASSRSSQRISYDNCTYWNVDMRDALAIHLGVSPTPNVVFHKPHLGDNVTAFKHLSQSQAGHCTRYSDRYKKATVRTEWGSVICNKVHAGDWLLLWKLQHAGVYRHACELRKPITMRILQVPQSGGLPDIWKLLGLWGCRPKTCVVAVH